MRIIFDLETNALELQDITKVHCLAAKELGLDQMNEFSGDTITHGLDLLFRARQLVGQNICAFDLPVLKHLYNWTPHPQCQIVDTLLLSRLANPDRQKPFNFVGKAGPHSIEVWGHRLGRHKPEHTDWSTFSPEMMTRCKEDVLINELMYEALYKEMSV